MEAYTLLEVNQYIKRVLALNFEEPFWVECEINQVSISRGNVYIQLIQKAEDSENILAQTSANIWYKKYLFIKKKLGQLVDSILKEGIKVKIKVNVQYSERYGLGLEIIDIDPSYTYGQFELNRQKTIEQLKKKNLIEKNGNLGLPLVIQNIGVISSSTAAGYQDFIKQLEDNPYGYAFKIHLYNAAMQGANTEREVVAALTEARAAKHDAIVIIRGGGSKLDLSGFDNYNIAHQVASSKTPVITGIGHEIDMTVTDIVAHTVMKTPTAVANMIIDHNGQFESEILTIESELKEEVLYILNAEREKLISLQGRLQAIPQNLISSQRIILNNLNESIASVAKQRVITEHMKLDSISKRLVLLDPSKILERGYALIQQGDKLVTKKSKVKSKPEDLDIIFSDGTLTVKQK